MNRVVVIGAPGAGKSTFAARLGQALGTEVVHLDALYWKDGTPPSPTEWARLEQELIDQERWIIDGNYSASLVARIRAADTVVLLAAPTVVCLLRYARRALAFRNGNVPGMAPARRTRLDVATLIGIVRFRRDHMPGFHECLAEHASGRRIDVLRRKRDVERYLAGADRTP